MGVCCLAWLRFIWIFCKWMTFFLNDIFIYVVYTWQMHVRFEFNSFDAGAGAVANTANTLSISLSCPTDSTDKTNSIAPVGFDENRITENIHFVIGLALKCRLRSLRARSKARG